MTHDIDQPHHTDELNTVGLAFTQNGSLMTVRLDSPDGNLMTLDMCDSLASFLRTPPAGVHVVVLEAAGDAFCLGRERTAATPDDLPGEVQRLIALNDAFAQTTVVTVTRVQGNAAGFGVGLVALTDVAIALESATFGFPEVGLNLAPTLVLAWLARTVGRREAFWMTATGATVSGAEAVRLGLVNEVVGNEHDFDEAVSRRVEMLQARSPRVHAEIRAMLRSASTLSETQAYELAADRLVLGSLRRAKA